MVDVKPAQGAPLFGRQFAESVVRRPGTVVPAGVGVREGTMTLLLAVFMPHATAAVLAIASRLWITLLEVLLLGAARLLIPGPELDAAASGSEDAGLR